MNVYESGMTRSVITASGRFLPTRTIPNTHFLNHDFFGSDGRRLERPNPEIIQKLYDITGIQERRYVSDDLTTSEIAFRAAEDALRGVDRESLDYILVAQNLGDLCSTRPRLDMVPTVAARVKHKLRIRNPYTIALDVPFGCPGWLQGMIMADYFIKSGDARRILVIGAEILSRTADPHDIDSMIYADGAGATLLEATDQDAGILSHAVRSDTHDHAYLLRMGESYNQSGNGDLFLKMQGHDIYKYAVKTVPEVVRRSLEKSGIGLNEVKKVLIHQANEKMDEAILKALFRLYGIATIPAGIMPMIISWTGNSSVATLPTLYDLIRKGELQDHSLGRGDIVVFASVGAGMNINAMVYRMP